MAVGEPGAAGHIDGGRVLGSGEAVRIGEVGVSHAHGARLGVHHGDEAGYGTCRIAGKREGDASVPLDGRKTSIKTLEWEYIHQTLVECDFNISEAARRLGMHRRTLARKLEKRQLR